MVGREPWQPFPIEMIPFDFHGTFIHFCGGLPTEVLIHVIQVS